MNKLTKTTFTKGLLKGLDTTWSLAKIIFPITIIVGILKYTPIIEILTKVLAPLMGIFGLSGDSAIVFVLGNFLNLYAAIGAILAMEMTVKEVFILSVMLSFSHNIIIETAITTRIGVNPWLIAALRMGMAFFFAFIINLVWHGGQEIAQYGLIAPTTEVLTSWPEIILHAIQTAFVGVLQIALIVIPIMIMIEVLKDINILQILSRFMSPITRILGVSEKTSVTLLAGIFFGIAYGAGVIIQTAKEENLSKRDIYLISIFLVTCHAVIEDTLIFLPLGINIIPLLIIRIVVAFIITMLTAHFWDKVEKKAHG